MAAHEEDSLGIEVAEGAGDAVTGSNSLSSALQGQDNGRPGHIEEHIKENVDEEIEAQPDVRLEENAAGERPAALRTRRSTGSSSGHLSLPIVERSSSSHGSEESSPDQHREVDHSAHAVRWDSDISDYSDSDMSLLDDVSFASYSTGSRNETVDGEGSQSTADLTNNLKSWFEVHRQKLRAELRDMKDENGKRLFSDTEINRQLPNTRATTPPPTSTRGRLPDGIDSAFGHRVTFGRFWIPEKSDQPHGFHSYKIRKSKVAEKLLDFPRSQGDNPMDLLWVHLPVNNLLWVQEVMLAILNRKYNDKDESERVLNRCLRRERNAIQRAFESETPTMSQPLNSACRKIYLSGSGESDGHDIFTYMMPYLHWERSLSRIHASKIIQDSEDVAKHIMQHGRKILKMREVSSLPCTGFEKMVRYYSVGRSGLLMRQTLDQAYYQNLDTTKSRDLDQVVERYSRKRGWKDHAHRVLMVDQLWLWIIDNDTVITCFPNSFPYSTPEDKPESHDILASLLKYFETPNKRRWIKNAHQLAYFIIDRCASSVVDRQLHLDKKFDFLGMFQESIADVMEQQTRLYTKFSRDLRQGRFANDFEAVEDFRLLEEAKDILDELRIMRDINFRQSALFKNLSGLAPSPKLARQYHFLTHRPSERTEAMKEMVDKAQSAYEAIIHLIDLKQKQGNLFQSTAIRGLLQQSEKSGETLMVFTIVTILFLPLSTLASFFSLNARELNDGHLTIGVVFAYIFPVSAFIIFLSLLFGFSNSARKSLPWVRSTREG